MSIRLHADAHAPGTPLAHFWSTVAGAGRAAEGLRATWQDHLRMAVDACGFRYIRFHGLFHDDMFVHRDGTYNFQYVDDLFDRLLDAGVRPFVELAFMPGDLARQRATVFWWGGHGSPPTDYAAWAELVGRTVRHWVDRYGPEEVRQWYFEVWNEPNLRPFFAGTRSEYFELYAVTARALKDVDARLRVGGPATSNFVPDGRFDGEVEDRSQHAVVTSAPDLDSMAWRPVWLEAFLDHCHRNAVPVDFVSVHPYPTDWALDGHGKGANYTRGVDSTRQDLALLRRIVDDSPFPRAEIHLTEWNSTPSSRDHSHDYPQAATFVVKANVESIGLVDSLAYWTFTDVFEEEGAGPTAFHGGFGMINYQGIAKPTFHAYRFLNSLGDELVARSPGGVVTRHATGGLTALAYHYPDRLRLSVPLSTPTRQVADETLALGGPEVLDVELTGLAPGRPVRIETLDADHGNAIAAWRAMGEPEPLNRDDVAALRAAADRTLCETAHTGEDGTLRLRRRISPWGVVLITTEG